MSTQKPSSSASATHLAEKYTIGKPIQTYNNDSFLVFTVFSIVVFILSLVVLFASFEEKLSTNQNNVIFAERLLRYCSNCSNALALKKEMEQDKALLAHTLPSSSDIQQTLGMLLVSFALLYYAWRSRKQRIYLFTGGLLYNNRGYESIVRWDEVDGVAFKENTKTLLFIKDDGSAFIMPAWSGGAINPDAIEDTLLPYLLPSLLGRYANGEALVFGDVAVTKQGVRYQAILASWQQIEGAQTSLGLLSLKSNGQWHKMPPSSKAIPGARLCAALIQRVKGLSN